MWRRAAARPKCNCSASTAKEDNSWVSSAINGSYHTLRNISLDESSVMAIYYKWTRGTSMSVMAYIGIVAAFCTTVAFVPQIVKLRKQGGKDLSYPMLFLYLAGVLLWLIYGVQVHAAAVVWANALTGVLVLVSIVLKANPSARKLDTGARRLRIAVDMDEVIADAFGKHLHHYT